MKKISVIIPCYNVELYIDRCFDSLINQTIGSEQMELIFVNDASTDGTLERLMSYERAYPDTVIVINLEENQMQGAARNIALSYASAPYVGYVDSDDWVEVNMYEKLLSVIERYDCDFVECRWDFAKDEKHRKLPKQFGKEGFIDLSKPELRSEFIRERVALAVLWDKLYKKSFLIENNIFCPEQVKYEDLFFSYLCYLYADSYYCIDDILYHYFVNAEGTVQKKRQEYQLDKMTVMLGFLYACKERGLWKPYQVDIEWLFLEKYYVYMLWEIFENYPEQAYEYYIQMKDVIYEEVPDYKQHPYRKLKGNEFDDVMLKLLDYNLNEEQFLKLKKHMMEQFHTTDAQAF